MRITGGTYKGRNIPCPPGVLRPAMDRMRESLFAIWGNLEGRTFLDLFSGSGIIALEAASRGAEGVQAVERDVKKKDILKRNLSIAGCALSLMPVEQFISRHRHSFDIVFIDPPFSYKYKNDILQRLLNSRLLHKNSAVCLHFPSEDSINRQFIRNDGMLMMSCNKEKQYGRSCVNFYTLAPQLDPKEGR